MNIVQNQHIFPQKSISRFYNEDDTVQVFLKTQQRQFPARSNNKLFCFERVWDQRAEQGFGKEIEDTFQELAEVLLDDQEFVIPSLRQIDVTRFYSLWFVRSEIQRYDQHLAQGKFAPSNLSQEQKLNIELQHQIYTDSVGDVPTHMKRGRTMEMVIDQFAGAHSSLKWWVVTFPIQVIVPDSPKDSFIIPLGPYVCLLAHFDVCELTISKAKEFNLNAISNSCEYYFASDLSKTMHNKSLNTGNAGAG